LKRADNMRDAQKVLKKRGKTSEQPHQKKKTWECCGTGSQLVNRTVKKLGAKIRALGRDCNTIIEL